MRTELSLTIATRVVPDLDAFRTDRLPIPPLVSASARACAWTRTRNRQQMRPQSARDRWSGAIRSVGGTMTPITITAAGTRPMMDHQESKGDGAGTEACMAPLAVLALSAFSRMSRNGFMTSMGIGKTIVEFCSPPISVSVCR